MWNCSYIIEMQRSLSIHANISQICNKDLKQRIDMLPKPKSSCDMVEIKRKIFTLYFIQSKDFPEVIRVRLECTKVLQQFLCYSTSTPSHSRGLEAANVTICE